MRTFLNCKNDLGKTLRRIIDLSTAQHARREKFLAKLGYVFLEGAETGIFSDVILDPERNLLANVESQLHTYELSPQLQTAISDYSLDIQSFNLSLKGSITPAEAKCLYGMQAAMLFYVNDRLTFGRLQDLMSELNQDDSDNFSAYNPGLFEELPELDKESMFIETQYTLKKELIEIGEIHK